MLSSRDITLPACVVVIVYLRGYRMTVFAPTSPQASGRSVQAEPWSICDTFTPLMDAITSPCCGQGLPLQDLQGSHHGQTEFSLAARGFHVGKGVLLSSC